MISSISTIEAKYRIVNEYNISVRYILIILLPIFKSLLKTLFFGFDSRENHNTQNTDNKIKFTSKHILSMYMVLLHDKLVKSYPYSFHRIVDIIAIRCGYVLSSQYSILSNNHPFSVFFIYIYKQLFY